MDCDGRTPRLRWQPSLGRRQVMLGLVVGPTVIASMWPTAEAAAATLAAVPDDAVSVVRNGNNFTVDVVMQVPVPPALAFAVLVDFERMTSFVPDLSFSQVLQRSGDSVTVSQKGAVHWGLLTMQLASVRELRLTPPSEIRGRSVGGSFKRMETHMLLAPQPGGATQITYHAEGEPGDWFPPLIGPAVVRRQTASQFTAMLQEMLRRQASGGAVGP